MKKGISTYQLSILRRAIAGDSVMLGGDRCTGKALVARGLAVETGDGFMISAEGRLRARFAADYIDKSTAGGPCAARVADQSLMENLE